MIVKQTVDYVGLTYQGNKLANAGNAAYWLRSQEDEGAIGVGTQDTHIIEAFNEIAALLGYRVEKVRQPAAVPEAAE
jgi:hypothetical protein